MTDQTPEARSHEPTAEPLALRLNDQLGRLVDAEMAAYSDAAYADHGSARDQLERFAADVRAAVQAAERERCASIARHVADGCTDCDAHDILQRILKA